MKGKNILRIGALLLVCGLCLLSCKKEGSDDPTPEPTPSDKPTPTPDNPNNPVVDPDKPNTDPVNPDNPNNPVVDPDNPNTDPVNPDNPDNPVVDPNIPVDPDNPVVDPNNPSGPSTDPSNPSDPLDPGTDPVNPPDPSDQPAPVEPVDPVDPTPVDPPAPGEPEQPADVYFKVSYDANGGSIAPAPEDIKKDEQITVASAISRDKYEFKGWKCSDGKTYAGGESVVVSSDLTFTAVWEAIVQKYSVWYDANGGKGSVPSAQKINENESISLYNGSSLTMTDHLFDGWQGNDGKTYQAGDNFTVTGDITFTAVWKENFSLTFNGNGYNGTMPKAVKFENGKAAIPSASFSREGFEFLGWSLDRDARVADYTAGDIVNNADKSVTLYAVWKAEKFTYSFHWNVLKEKQINPVTFSAKDIQHGKALFNIQCYGLTQEQVLVGWEDRTTGRIYKATDLFDVLENREFFPVIAKKANTNMENWNVNKY